METEIQISYKFHMPQNSILHIFQPLKIVRMILHSQTIQKHDMIQMWLMGVICGSLIRHREDLTFFHWVSKSSIEEHKSVLSLGKEKVDESEQKL